jgi:transcriptional regulator with XRE-family HTH domain
VNVLRTPSDNRLIEMLTNARRRAGLTLQQLSERVCLDQTLIARYERESSSHRQHSRDD